MFVEEKQLLKSSAATCCYSFTEFVVHVKFTGLWQLRPVCAACPASLVSKKWIEAVHLSFNIS